MKALEQGQHVLVLDGDLLRPARVRRSVKKHFWWWAVCETSQLRQASRRYRLYGKLPYAHENRFWARGWNSDTADALRALVALTR